MSKVTRCMIVDDEPLAIQFLTAHINQMPELKLVATAENLIDAIRLLKEHTIDLLFLDIQMPILTGIKLLRTLQNPPGVIFTTAYQEFAVESYELDVVDYLMKPITFIRFLKAVNKFIGQKQRAPSPTTPTKTTDTTAPESMYVNKKYVKVIFSNILYIESVKDYIISTRWTRPSSQKKRSVNLPKSSLITLSEFIDPSLSTDSRLLHLPRIMWRSGLRKYLSAGAIRMM